MVNRADKSICFYSGDTNEYVIYIKDSTLTIDSNGHAAALEGKKITYELATPIQISQKNDMKYKVDRYSTEELLVPLSQNSAPTSTALNADIDYQYRG